MNGSAIQNCEYLPNGMLPTSPAENKNDSPRGNNTNRISWSFPDVRVARLLVATTIVVELLYPFATGHRSFKEKTAISKITYCLTMAPDASRPDFVCQAVGGVARVRKR